MMGAVARAAQEGGAPTMGVIPAHLVTREREELDLDRLVITENMHERKKVMFMNSDAVVALPGGAGSLDEFFEVLTWAQLGLHRKAIILLNIGGYWNKLIGLIDHVVAEGFADQSLREFVTVADSVADTVKAIRAAG